MTLGYYQNFPTNIHHIDKFKTTLSSRQLQQKLIQVLQDINHKEFSFEEVANPTIPEGRVIFEFGVAEADAFTFIDAEELKKALETINKTRMGGLDFFCSIRYYKVNGDKKKALKFDYYMLRTGFSKELFEVQVFHERGPRYLSPQELVEIIVKFINSSSKRKILKETAADSTI